MQSDERRESQGVLDNKKLHKCSSPQTTTVTGREMKSKYSWGALHYVFLFPVWLHSSPSTSAGRSEHAPPREQWKDKAQTWCACSQHLSSKAAGVIKKLTMKLNSARLSRAVLFALWHVSNGGPTHVRHPPGTSASPAALSDWRAIYLSASTSAPSLPNPPHCRRPAGPHGEHSVPHRSQIHQVGGRRRLLEGSGTSVRAE